MSPLVALAVAGLVSAAPKTRVFIDPGHGVGTNSGMISVSCADEQDIVLEISQGLAQHLRETGKFRSIKPTHIDKIAHHTLTKLD